MFITFYYILLILITFLLFCIELYFFLITFYKPYQLWENDYLTCIKARIVYRNVLKLIFIKKITQYKIPNLIQYFLSYFCVIVVYFSINDLSHLRGRLND